MKLKATAVEEERDATEDVGAREVYRRLQLQDENGQIPPNAWTNAYAEKDTMRFLPEAWSEFTSAAQLEAGIQGGRWISIGPGNIGGRIRSIIIHPDSTTTATTMWAGAVSGGVWKSTNGGDTWTTNTDFLANLAVNCMVIDPTNPLILYAGTGEGFTNNDAIRGNGIFKTTDGGDHWEQVAFTKDNPNFYFVNRLAISPTNSQLLLAATPNGIFRTTDGGGHWFPATGLPSDTWADVRFRPPSIPGEVAIPDVPAINCLTASVEGRVYYSTDQGASWNPAIGLPPPAGYQRIELAYSRSQPSIVYASKANLDLHLTEIFRSENGGFSFASLGHPQHPYDPNQRGAFWYANVLWVDPLNSDTVIVGGDYLLRTMDRGMHWEEADAFSHQDTHVLVEHPRYGGTGTARNATVYSGNDGGVHRTDNILATTTPPAPPGAVVWTSRNNSLGVTQFYGAAGHAASGTIIGGTQDNGTVRFRPSAGPEHWDSMAFGDAGRCAVDQTETPYFYGENLALQIYRNTHGGGSSGYKSDYIWGGIDHPHGIPGDCGGLPCANVFTAPFVIDPNLDQQNEQKTLLAGGKSLWRTTNARTEDAVDVCWAEIKSPIGPLIDYIGAIAIAKGSSNLIWIGYNNSSVFYTLNGTLGATCPSPTSTPTWISGDPNNVLPRNRLLNHIAIADPSLDEPPEAARTVYVTFSGFFPSMTDMRGNVWKRDGHGTWTDIHHNLPSAPVFSLVISPSNPDFLYVGTEVGVFASSDGGRAWSPAFGGSSADSLVYSLVVSAAAPSSPDIIYAGTEDGVFASQDGGETWAPGFGGPANTRVAELFWMINGADRKLIVATHGRGMFTLATAQ